MLRKFILGMALLLAAVGLWLLTQRLWVPGWQALALAALVFGGTAFERWRYHTGPAPAGARWEHTGEKFADPVSGEEMEVQYDPGSGERRYVRRGRSS
jgi:hypothetical protein